MRNLDYPFVFTFLMDTVPQENQDKNQKWYTWDVLDVAKTPPELIPHCKAAKKIIDEYYQKENQFADANRTAFNNSQKAQPQYTQPSSGECAWGEENFEGENDKPPF